MAEENISNTYVSETRDYEHALEGYKIVRADLTSVFGKKKYVLGKKYRFGGKAIAMCDKGYHASPTLKEAVNWCEGDMHEVMVPNRRIFRVKQWGEIIKMNPVTKYYQKVVSRCIQLVEEIPLEHYFACVNQGVGCIGAHNRGNTCIGTYNNQSANIGRFNETICNVGSFNRQSYDLRHLGGYNIGYYNSGAFNTGSDNHGYFNLGNNINGSFNIRKGKQSSLLYLFNKPVREEDESSYVELLTKVHDPISGMMETLTHDVFKVITTFSKKVTSNPFLDVEYFMRGMRYAAALNSCIDNFHKAIRAYTKDLEDVELIRKACKEVVPDYYDEKIFNQIFFPKYNKRDSRGRFCK